MDTLGAIVGPATAFVLLPWVGHHYPTLFALTLIPGLTTSNSVLFWRAQTGNADYNFREMAELPK